MSGLLLSACAFPRMENTPIPGGMKSASPGGGMEVTSEDNRRGTKVTITPFVGSEGPDFNSAQWDEKINNVRLTESQRKQAVRDQARHDAVNGVDNAQSIPGDLVNIYYREHERASQGFQRRDIRSYQGDEYRRGQDDYRNAHPQYKDNIEDVERVEEIARGDAYAGVYRAIEFNPVAAKYYSQAYEREVGGIKRMQRKASKDASEGAFDPPRGEIDERLLRVYEDTFRNQQERRW